MTARKKSKRTDHILSLPSVRYWQGQLNRSGIRHDIKITASTRDIYLHKLSMFNEWLAGRGFDVRVPAVANGRITHENARKSFASVEGLLRFGEDGNGNEKGGQEDHKPVYGRSAAREPETLSRGQSNPITLSRRRDL